MRVCTVDPIREKYHREAVASNCAHITPTLCFAQDTRTLSVRADSTNISGRIAPLVRARLALPAGWKP